jgi:hypothetical protein
MYSVLPRLPPQTKNLKLKNEADTMRERVGTNAEIDPQRRRNALFTQTKSKSALTFS